MPDQLEAAAKDSADCFDYVVPDSYNTRKVPRAEYIEDIEEFVKQHNNDVAAAIVALQEKLQKYAFMLDVVQKQRSSLLNSSAELHEDLDVISYLEGQEGAVEVRYELAAGVYAKATIPKSDRINLWLGSRVMVEYSHSEARSLLNKHLGDAKEKIEDMARNLQFLKEQVTMVEVSISRVFNWDVQRRQEAGRTVE